MLEISWTTVGKGNVKTHRTPTPENAGRTLKNRRTSIFLRSTPWANHCDLGRPSKDRWSEKLKENSFDQNIHSEDVICAGALSKVNVLRTVPAQIAFIETTFRAQRRISQFLEVLRRPPRRPTAMIQKA